LSGLLATYPVFAAVLAGFGQRERGAAAAIRVLRGLLTGLFAYTGFFAALAIALPSLGIAGGFALATGVALAIQTASLRLVHRG
jgi:small neutral amino acid transporter SnatA (MarC family)